MKIDLHFFRSPTGQFVTLGLLVAVAITAMAWQHQQGSALPPAPTAKIKAALPQVFSRSGAKLELPKPADPAGPIAGEALDSLNPVPAVLPLTLTYHPLITKQASTDIAIPFGRLIPCATVFTLESNRLDTPIIALVTEDVWSQGTLLIPAGTEVHGRATLDRSRARIAAHGQWTLIWPPQSHAQTEPLQFQGMALERSETDPAEDYEGSAGLNGLVLRSTQAKEAKLFAATFLATATAALQDTRATTGPFGESIIPAVTLRNASLAGTSALLRDYANQLRAAVAEDGVYVRVPAGKPFYLYVSEPVTAMAVAATPSAKTP